MASFPMARFSQAGQYRHLDSDTDSSYDAHKISQYDAPKAPQAYQVPIDPRTPTRRDILRPRMLPSAAGRWHEFAPEFTNLLLTVAFVGLGIAVIKLRGQLESDWSDKVVSATKIAPSLFPILFSAVLGNTLKVWAYYKVERGATIGSLEQLLGSQTVAGTLKNVYVLRAFGVYTLLLIPLWAFNPLGSQASFRSVYLKEQFSSGTRLHSYQNNSFNYEAEQSALGSASGWESSQPMVRSLYGAALFSPDAGAQYSNGSADGFDDLIRRLGGVEQAFDGTDLWQNVRVPDITTLPGYDAKNASAWVDVPRDAQVVNYTSIIGLPARDADASFSGNLSFAVNSSYHDFKCLDWTNNTMDDFFSSWMKDNYHQLTNLYNKTLDVAPWKDATAVLLPFTSGFFLDTINKTSKSTDDATIALVSRGSDDYYSTRCTVSMRYVEVNITCLQDPSSPGSHASCSASHIRSIPDLPSTGFRPNSTAFNLIPHAYNIAHDYPTILAKTQHPLTSTQTELFISDPPNAFTGAAARIGAVELGAVPMPLFEKRFGLLFNTFWKATITPSLVVGGPMNATLLGLNVAFANTTAQWTQSSTPLYALDVPWLIVFFIANVVMFAAAIAAVVLKLQCHSPDILGYVSSLTRDSPFFALPGAAYGSVLDGAERARLLKNDRVRLVDVGRDEDVGRIALVPEDAPLPWRKVLPGRVYE